MPIAAGGAVLPLAGHVVRGSRRGRTLGAGSTACPQDASVAGPGSQVDGERELGAGARHALDGEVLVAESAVHGADVWGGTAPGMVSCSFTFDTSAVVCRHEPNGYHPRFAARKMSLDCVRLLHATHPVSGEVSEPDDTGLCRGVGPLRAVSIRATTSRWLRTHCPTVTSRCSVPPTACPTRPTASGKRRRLDA